MTIKLLFEHTKILVSIAVALVLQIRFGRAVHERIMFVADVIEEVDFLLSQKHSDSQ